MRLLLRAIVEMSSDLDLDATLHRIVTAAMDLTGSRYGAIAVHDHDDQLVSFVHAGMDADTVHDIGQLPSGKGVLGVALKPTEALWLNDLSTHPAALGFPAHHPPMRALLGVPITIRGEVFGNLYVANDGLGNAFTESDEIAARALASAAAVAIDSAQLLDRARASAAWITASREITTALLSDACPASSALQLIAERAMELAQAEQAIVLLPANGPADEIDTLVVSTAVGARAGEVLGQHVPVDGSTDGIVLRSGTPVITPSFLNPIPAFTDTGQRPAILMPLRAHDSLIGVLGVARGKDAPPFDKDCLDPVGDFADQAAMALTLATDRNRERKLGILADRERIAHGLHDHVIQRLFAAGLDLHSAIARSRSPEMTNRLTEILDHLQSTIEDIRTTIFDLHSDAGSDGTFLRRVQRLVAELTDNRPVATTLRTIGQLTMVGSGLAEHAEAVITEAISNAVRHSGASRLTVAITVADAFTIDIVDNGEGIPAQNQRRSGLANITQRAEQLGGTCVISSPPDGGTHVRWIVPLSSP
ncbi:histidine kinase [Mycobacterium kansasii]|nr:MULTISPECIES: GAF domain-containing protein [Mycobacterium]KZS59365.1 histidine kinase [Mycobacterium kansasii]